MWANLPSTSRYSNADGQQYRGIGDQSWQSNGYDGAANAYRVDVNGGACTVTMGTTGG